MRIGKRQRGPFPLRALSVLEKRPVLPHRESGEREAVYIEKSGKRGIRKDSLLPLIYIRKENVSK